MTNAEKDLKAIMDLLWEWMQGHGALDASINIYGTGRAYAYNLELDREGHENWVSEGYCPTKEKRARRRQPDRLRQLKNKLYP